MSGKVERLAEQFMAVFPGLDRAYGQYRLPVSDDESAGSKRKGEAKTVREPLTVAQWIAHLEGAVGVGVVPIRDDGTVRWAAIDVDVYQTDLGRRLEERIKELELPLILCRTKSGGHHCYLFLSESTSAELVRGRMMEWAVLLGHPGVEVFPKQVRLAGVKDMGNWINMPYFGGAKTDRYALYRGKKLSPEAFLRYVKTKQVSAEWMEQWTVPAEEMSDDLLGAPPCLQTLAREGLGEGGRNNGLFAFGTYIRKRFGPDGWQEKIDEYNSKFLNPPLGHREVGQIADHLSKKEYEYRCNEPPIVSCCNRAVCLKREFGIATAQGDPGVMFGELVKIDSEPPIWLWSVNGNRIELTTAELKDQQRFHSRCIEVLNIWPNWMKAKGWSELVRGKLEKVEVIPAPPEASVRGEIWMMLEQYCLSRMMGESQDDLLRDVPYFNSTTNEIFFIGRDFYRFLRRQEIRQGKHQVWAYLRSQGAAYRFMNIKGSGKNVFVIPAFEAFLSKQQAEANEEEAL